ncbi:competence protein ComK [Fictibacillus barbaricus]|uniref:Competence protein ComK n=1 Tax=Fictibacillus barbaricus TaxID=182136 RepID=A0ABS2ZEJ9_9BACL|nr:competence protein ComK [Fictibacillus barbaricus]MBN3545135.1 competence protein ComK [Fictibacillus barbaricus]GGB61448.1 hypothetical protein GCM10007199_29140 [Fictibacillus barbaricus]
MKYKFVQDKVEEYLINSDTMAIHPFVNQWGAVCAEIYERDAVILVEKKPTRIIVDTCPYYGGTYDGKKEAARINLGKLCFAPIMINSKLDIFFFPTQSPRKDTCIWLSHPHIDDYEKIGLKKVRVIFSNGMDLPIDSSHSAFRGKLHRAAHYRTMLTNRTTEKERERLRNRDLILT